MEAQAFTIDQPFQGAYEKFLEITSHLSAKAWLTDKIQPPDFSSCLLVFENKTRLATCRLLLLGCHGRFGVRFTA